MKQLKKIAINSPRPTIYCLASDKYLMLVLA